MDIAIIGAGNVGGNLGIGWSRRGHRVRFGARDPDKLRDLLAECGPQAEAISMAEAVERSEVVALAVPWQAAAEAVRGVAAQLRGKVLIDCTNPLAWKDGPVVAVATSGAEELAALCPGADVVKAFNCIGAERLLDPQVGGVAADMFLCGDSAAARTRVASLARDLGFEPVELGPLRNARLCEHLAVTWIHLAMVGGLGRDIALKVLR